MSSLIRTNYPPHWLGLVCHWLIDRIDRSKKIDTIDIAMLRKAVASFIDFMPQLVELNNLCASLLLLEARLLEVNAPMRVALKERLVTIQRELASLP